MDLLIVLLWVVGVEDESRKSFLCPPEFSIKPYLIAESRAFCTAKISGNPDMVGFKATTAVFIRKYSHFIGGHSGLS
jgi:hypothetical protein